VKVSDLKKLFECMSSAEREGFSRNGSIPSLFSDGINAIPEDKQNWEKESEVSEARRVQ
jgi:hypothetical protein